MLIALAIIGCVIPVGWFFYQVRQIDRNPHGHPPQAEETNPYLDD